MRPSPRKQQGFGHDGQRGKSASLDKMPKRVEGDLEPKLKKGISRFKKEFKRLRSQSGAANEDFRADNHAMAMYRSMLAMVLDLIPTAEKSYRHGKNESAAYAMNALLNQAKDLSAEIRNLTSLEEQAEAVCRDILNPSLVLFTQHLMTSFTVVKAKIDSTKLSSQDSRLLKDTLDEVLREHASYLQESSEAITVRTRAYLLGEADPTAEPVSGKKKRKGRKKRDEE